MSLATRNMGSQPVRITRPSGAAVMPKRGRDIDVRRAGEHRDLVRELPAALGPGRPLDKETRRTFEPLFAHDLSRVRIHDDKEAERFASSRGARAMTLGSHIVLAPGAYAPQSASGKKLVAHELAHTVQLGHLAPTLDAPTTSENAPLERDADRAAAHAVRGERVPPLARATAPVIARLPDGYKSKGDREAEVQFGKKVVSAIADFSWSDVKAAFYKGLISSMRIAQKAAFDGLRSAVANSSISSKDVLITLIDVFDEFVGVLITLVLAVVGIVVGFGEGVVDMVKGLVNLVLGIIKWIVLLFYGFIDKGAAFEKFSGEIATAAKNLLPGLKAIVSDWLDRFKKAPIDQGTIMIGELTGQILALIASFGLVASKAGAAPKLALAGTVPSISGGELVFARVAVEVNVAAPPAAAALTTTQAMRVAGSGGSGTPAGSTPQQANADPPQQQAEPTEKKADAKPSEDEFGLSKEKIKAIRDLFAKPLDETPNKLGDLWTGATNADDIKIVRANTNMAKNARDQIRHYFDLQRRRFWTAVQNNSGAKDYFTDIGFEFGEKGTAPKLTLNNGKVLKLDIDHITEIRENPKVALDANNLRLVPARENRTVLRLIHDLDPFQK